MADGDVAEPQIDGFAPADLTGPHLVTARTPTDAVRAANLTDGRSPATEAREDPRGLDAIL